MESLVDNLEATSHSVELEETTPGLSVKALEFDFKCLEKPATTVIEPIIVLNTDAKFFWKVVFTPPLKRGERVKYTFKEVRANNRPYSYQALMDRIAQRTYEYKDPRCEACEWTILYPTYELRHEFEFPDNYELDKYFPDVVIGEAKVRDENELKRINEGNMFRAEKLFDKWILKLEVSKPIHNHTYYTYYVPARSKAISS